MFKIRIRILGITISRYQASARDGAARVIFGTISGFKHDYVNGEHLFFKTKRELIRAVKNRYPRARLIFKDGT